MVTVILLPGMDGSGSLFEPFVAALGPAVRSKIVSYPPDKALGYSGLDALVRRALPDGPYAIVAESFSGPIALSLAAERPPGLKALILCCTFARCPLPVPRWLHGVLSALPVWHAPRPFIAAALFGSNPDPALQDALAAALARVAPDTWRARLRAILEADLTGKLARIQVPTLYLRATRDRVVPRSAGQLICDLVPDAKLVDLDSPHFMLQTKPHEAAQRVLRFLAGT